MKKSGKKDITSVRAEGRFYDGIRLLPVILFVAVVPLLVHALPYKLPLSKYTWIAAENDTVLWDVFSYIKLKAMMVIALAALMVFVSLLVKGRLSVKKTKVYIPMALYLLMVILSCAGSDLKEVAWRGGMDRFEGTLAIICYIWMLFYTIQAVRSIRDITAVFAALGVTVLLECLIGLSQLVGADVLFSNVGRFLIAGNMSIELEFQKGQVYQTFGNMNYIPFWLSLVIPLLLLICIKCVRDMAERGDVSSDRKPGLPERKYIPVFAIAILLLGLAAVNCLGAGSAGGLMGLAGAVLLMVIAFIPRRIIRIGTVVFLSVIVLAGIMILYSSDKDEVVIDYFETGEDSLKMSLDGRGIDVKISEEGDLVLYDDDGKVLPLYSDDAAPWILSIDDDLGYGNVAFEKYVVDDGNYLMIHLPSDGILFHFGDTGVTCCNPYGYEVPLNKTKRLGFYGHYGFASGRGYIWADSIPLLAESFFTGSGADTFMFIFPQTDYAGKISAGGQAVTITDKAHNLFLQMALTTGVVSLMAFLAMLAIMFRQVYRRFNGNEGALLSISSLTWEKALICGAAFGIMGFLIAGLTCDSTVSVMPIFYTMLGSILGRCCDQ